jgi:adenylate kinase
VYRREAVLQKDSIIVCCMLGKPAVGKGTQAGKLEKLGFLRITSSEELDKRGARNKASTGLTQDQIVIPVVNDVLRERHTDQHVVLDGFPRSAAQVDFVMEYVNQLLVRYKVVLLTFVYLNVTDSWAVNLNNYRNSITPPDELRADGSPEAYDERLEASRKYLPEVFTRIDEVAPGHLRRIGGEGTPDEVHEMLIEAIGLRHLN